MRAHKRLIELANPRNALLFLRITCVDLLFALLLRMLGPRNLFRFLPLKVKEQRQNSDRINKIVRYTDFLVHSGVPVLKGACLKRSLLLYYFLRQKGVPVVINIGVTKENGNLIGHSWLTLDGNLYCEKSDVERFSCVLSHPSSNTTEADIDMVFPAISGSENNS
jgi:hypothetical protein